MAKNKFEVGQSARRKRKNQAFALYRCLISQFVFFDAFHGQNTVSVLDRIRSLLDDNLEER